MLPELCLLTNKRENVYIKLICRMAMLNVHTENICKMSAILLDEPLFASRAG